MKSAIAGIVALREISSCLVNFRNSLFIGKTAMKPMVILASTLLVAAFASRDAKAASLILNGGFEGGVQSVSIGGFTNTSVPNNWTPNAAFVEFTGFNHLTPSPVNSGIAALIHRRLR